MSNGKKTTFYNINVSEIDFIDVDFICEKYGFTFAEGNVLKALVGIAKERSEGKTRHIGTGSIRDSNKLLHYAQLIQKQWDSPDIPDVPEPEDIRFKDSMSFQEYTKFQLDQLINKDTKS